MIDAVDVRDVRKCGRRGRVLDNPCFRSYSCRVALSALVVGFCSGFACSAPIPTATAEPLRVVALATAPFVLPGTDPPTGFSVDLWNEVARRMHVDFTWRMVREPAELFAAVQGHDADVAVGAIVITREREEILDFSLPFLDSGLRIAVPKGSQRGVITSIVWSIPWKTVGSLLVAAIVVVFLLANLLLLIRRRKGPGIIQGLLVRCGRSGMEDHAGHCGGDVW